MGQVYDLHDRSDEQLLQLLRDTQDAAGALAQAVRLELDRRGIDADMLLRAENVDTRYRRELAFDWYHKLGMLLLPFFIGAMFYWLTSLAGSGTKLQFLGFPFLFLCYYLLHQQLKKNGYDQMATDFKHWTSYTLYIYIGLLILAGLALLVVMMFAPQR